MPSQARYLDDERVIEVLYTGAVTEADLAESFASALALAQQHDVWHVVTDNSGLTEAPTVVDLYEVVQALDAVGRLGEFREAVIPAPGPDGSRSVRFYEDACVNRGLNVRGCATREEALAWLASP